MSWKANKHSSEISQKSCVSLSVITPFLQRRVKGIITRKDLMGFQIEERIHSVLHDSPKAQEMQSPSAHRQSVETWTEWDSFQGR